jgi:hypothetical protein
MEKYNSALILDELRQVWEEQMMQPNPEQINHAPRGSFLYNPTAWGSFTPEPPSKLFVEERFLYNVGVMLPIVSTREASLHAHIKNTGAP